MSNDVNIILCTFTALVEISFFLGSGWSLEMISCSKQLQRLLLMIIKAWNTAWSPVESLSFLTRLSAIWYQWNQRIHHQSPSSYIMFFALCKYWGHKKNCIIKRYQKDFFRPPAPKWSSQTFKHSSDHWAANSLICKFLPYGSQPASGPEAAVTKWYKSLTKTHPQFHLWDFLRNEWNEWNEWRAFPFQFLPNCPMISCRHRTGHSGDLRWLVNSPPASGNECTKVRRTSHTKRPAWRCHQSWTWWVSQCFPARCCKMLQAAARDGDDGMT